MSFECIDGCHACCGLVPIPKYIYEGNKHLIEVNVEKLYEVEGEIYPIAEDFLCVFLDRKKNRCNIYRLRPMVCRMYGIEPKLPCPYIKANGKPRNPAQVRHWQRKINKDVDDILGRLQKRVLKSRQFQPGI